MTTVKIKYVMTIEDKDGLTLEIAEAPAHVWFRANGEFTTFGMKLFMKEVNAGNTVSFKEQITETGCPF